jgi:hypothetical protein
MLGNNLVTALVFIGTIFISFGGALFIIPDANNNIGGFIGSIIGTTVVVTGITYVLLNQMYPRGYISMGGGDFSSSDFSTSSSI